MAGPTARMLTLLSLLQARREWPGRVLAERLEVTTRTVRRDVERLRDLGYRISSTKGPDGGYRLAAGSELPPMLFDDDQAVAIAVALHLVPASGVDVEEAAARALATVRQVMPSRLRHRIDALQFVGTSPRVRVDAATVEAVSEAVRRSMTLRFTYRDHDAPPRRVEPHGLVARRGLWYLVAWDLDRSDWRIFRLDRLAPRVPLGPGFVPREVPTGSAQTYLSARSKGSTDEDRWPCVGRVEISLPVEAITPWVEDGALEPIDGDTSLVSLGSWSWTGLLSQVLRFDAPFRVLGPPELVEAAQVLSDRLTASRGSPTSAALPAP